MRGAPKVFLVFLRLGCTSFGGPVAHLGYFRADLVAKRQWLTEATFADLVALCQFMPGPASSQTGMAIGLLRAGPLGMLAAWVGFTLPSALVMTLFGYGIAAIGDVAHAGWLRGLKLVAVAVVAQAIWGMARSLAPDRERATIAVAACLVCWRCRRPWDRSPPSSWAGYPVLRCFPARKHWPNRRRLWACGCPLRLPRDCWCCLPCCCWVCPG
jgi:chromate transporter